MDQRSLRSTAYSSDCQPKLRAVAPPIVARCGCLAGGACARQATVLRGKRSWQGSARALRGLDSKKRSKTGRRDDDSNITITWLDSWTSLVQNFRANESNDDIAEIAALQSFVHQHYLCIWEEIKSARPPSAQGPRFKTKYEICGTDASQAEAFVQTNDCAGCDCFV